MKSKLRVAVLVGGPSAEHEVSLKTGAMVAKALDRKKYLVKTVVVSRRGKWPMTLSKLKRDFDIVFNAMHGEYGEDGTLQRLLDKHRIHYTGSGAKGSSLGMDKIKSMQRFKKAGLHVPPWQLLTNKNYPFTYAVVVKPVDRGSSVGVTIVKKPNGLPVAIKRAFKTSRRVIVQQFIPGREITCGVLEIKGKLRALPPTEIIPQSSAFFDYHEKYASDGAKEITPARISRPLIKKVQQAALKAHKAIGASGYSRSDFIFDGNKFWILEINTLPGLTSASLLPKAARAAGISFSKLLDTIIASAH